MAETSQYTDLLTPDEIKVDALNSLGIDITDATAVDGLGGSYKDAAIIAIRDVTEAIQSYLDRKLIVRKWDIDIQTWQWNQNKALDKEEHYPKHWPVVQVETSGVTISNDAERLLTTAKKDEVEFYAGYKRRDQTIDENVDTDINIADNGLDELTETPGDLPYNIRRVAQRLVMYELTQAKQNTYAVSSVTKTAGNATAEITKSRERVYEDELSKLHSYRRVA